MPILDFLWGETFGELNLIQSLAEFKKPVFIGLGRYDYLVGPVSLWDEVDDMYENVKKVGITLCLKNRSVFIENLLTGWAWLEKSIYPPPKLIPKILERKIRVVCIDGRAIGFFIN